MYRSVAVRCINPPPRVCRRLPNLEHDVTGLKSVHTLQVPPSHGACPQAGGAPHSVCPRSSSNNSTAIFLAQTVSWWLSGPMPDAMRFVAFQILTGRRETAPLQHRCSVWYGYVN
eukprot:307073-Chlamydomonas_euryale.AAC.3